MPETDWLTGLSSRAAFARQVDQSDRDRDRFVVALLEVDHLSEINRQLGYDIGDDLVRAVGRSLAGQRSVSTVVARLGGAQFGLLAIQGTQTDAEDWLGPIISATEAALSSWILDQVDYSGGCAVEPRLLAGAANGSSGQVWADAAAALDVAHRDPRAESVIVFDLANPIFATLHEQRMLADDVEVLLAAGKLRAVSRPIEPLDGDDCERRLARLGIAGTDSPQDASRPQGELDTAALPLGMQSRLDRWLVERAVTLLTQECGQLRLIVPQTARVASGSAFALQLSTILDQHRIPPDRLLFEVAESEVVTTEAGREFCHRLALIGSGVVLTDCEGGWPAWRAIEDYPISVIKPHRHLVEQAGAADRAAVRILDALIANAAASSREVIAPFCQIRSTTLADLGFINREGSCR